MLKKSIRARLLAVFLGTSLVISIAVGIHTFLMTNELLHKKANDVMAARCEAEAAHINALLDDIQRNVRLMSWYCLDRLDDPLALTDADALQDYTSSMLEMFSAVAQNTSGAQSCFLRFDPALTSPTAGFNYTRSTVDGVFHLAATTALTASREDGADWYWLPKESGQPIWMEPYSNPSNGQEVISYIIPLYQDGLFIGVVGIDVDFSYLHGQAHTISLYRNGYAYLTDADNNPYHDHYSAIDHHMCIEAREPLINGMYLTLHASYLDVIRESYPIIIRSAIIFLVLMVFFAIVIFHTTRHIIQPLRELTQAVRRLEKGETDVRIPGVSRQDELGVLAQAFRQMSVSISTRLSSINDLAFRDSLTGVKSHAAYTEAIALIDQRIPLEPTPFGLIMTDSNDLKHINDVYGHEVGNAYIRHMCHIICDTFKHSPVYRIGGDEFVVLLQGQDLDDHAALLARMDADFAASPFPLDKADGGMIPCRIAHGWAIYDPRQDKDAGDVFIRADARMYEHKRMLKGQHR